MRRSPIRKRRATPRRVRIPRCTHTSPTGRPNCKRYAFLEDLCRQHIEIVMDDLARQQVFERDGFKCVNCGTTEHLQWSHRVPQTYKGTIWFIDNADTHCRACHLRFTYDHLLHERHIIARMGREPYEAMKELAWQHARGALQFSHVDTLQRLRTYPQSGTP